ncbi:MAG: prolyl oligopeptidase family serine peptidase [Propionibacteriaceae bacterium]|nr:prolyl oligopeptidase family serine peptidase [Propionibacteriaceae bacterium]
MSSPRAQRLPQISTWHGRRRWQPYAWLRQADDPAVLRHLEAENAHTSALTADTADLAGQILAEIRGRDAGDHFSAPEFSRDRRGRDWWHYSQTLADQPYPRYFRRPASSRADGPELAGEGSELLLDGNLEAAGHDFCALGDLALSPDGDRLAWTVDWSGQERYELRLRPLDRVGPDHVELTDLGQIAWLDDDHLLYTRLDDSWRPYQVWRHRLGQPSTADQLLWHETDEAFWLDLDASSDQAWLIVTAASKRTSQSWLVSRTEPAADLIECGPRRTGQETCLDVAGPIIFFLHNRRRADFDLAWAEVARPDQWHDSILGLPGQRLLGVDLLADWLVLSWRRDGLLGLSLYPRQGASLGQPRELAQPDRLANLTACPDDWFESDHLMITSQTYTAPIQVDDLDLAGDRQRPVHRDPVGPDPAGRPFAAQDYLAERLWVEAPDGQAVPVSCLRRADRPIDGSGPGLLYVYGAYEICLEPEFSLSRLSLLDRGFVVAYAHVRGGGELGHDWYEQARLGRKATTFSDLVACAEGLIATGLVDPARLGLRGFSAGGLAVGASLNLAPQLFRAAHVGVGFVDPLTTMLDPSLPLTVTEYDEWGDPALDPQIYQAMAAYAPSENVQATAYPAILATASWNDSRVSYAEPATWVQALRQGARQPPDRPILLRTDLVGGHGGPSDRFQAWAEEAAELAWLIEQLTARE